MKLSMRINHRSVLLAAGLGLCLTTVSAHAQRGGGRGGGSFQSARAASANGQTGGSNSGMSRGCPNSSGSTSSGTTTGTTTSGVTTQSGQFTAQSIGTVTAQRMAYNSAVVQYSGSTASVQTVYLAVLDANGNMVSQRMVTPSRAVATLAVNSSARFYGAMVVYANGTSRTTFLPIR